jgi:chemotaxis protein CheD
VSRAAELLRPAPTFAGTEDGGGIAGRRFYDPTHGGWIVKVLPGEFYVTEKSDEVLVTVLGSCVSACIRDQRTGLGGMNHFMLPLGQAGDWGNDPQSTRYGNFAMERLLNELIKAGCSRERLEIKVFGGGKAEGLNCAAQDLGGQYPRRIHYFPATGRVVRRLLGGSETAAIAREEFAYASRLSSTRTAGDIQLFEDDA